MDTSGKMAKWFASGKKIVQKVNLGKWKKKKEVVWNK